jgi:hypothetical protein
MDLGFEHEAFRIYQQVTLTAFDLLTSVVTALFSAHRGALDRLGIHYARAGLGISLLSDSQAFADSPVDPFPGTVHTVDFSHF